MDSDDPSPTIKVVIISLPPPDNPSLGKTITAFTLTSDHTHTHNSYSQTQHIHDQNQDLTQNGTQNQDFEVPNQSSLPPTQNPQNQASFFFNFTPRKKLLFFLSISLFAFIVYRSMFSYSFQQLQSPSSYDDDDNNDDRNKTQTFVFPLYHKFGIRQISNGDFRYSKLVRLVNKENLMVNNDVGVFLNKKTQLGSLNGVSLAGDSSIFPVRGNVYPDGLYFTFILVGNPPRPYYLDIDTASDLTWIQCDAPCFSCAKGANALYKPRRDNIVLPKESVCVELHRNQNSGYCKTCQQCDYEIEYADHSSSMGVLAKDQIHLMMANGSSTKLKIHFGCAYDQQGVLLNTLAKTDGILGLSKSKVSLPSQLASRGIINNVVGHCLANDVSGGGYMFIGDDLVPRWGMAWAPMLSSLLTDSYQTQIMKLNYGSSPLSLGGQDARVIPVVFDTGSSYTYFTKEAYTELISSLKEVPSEALIQDTTDTTLPFCWKAKFPIRSVTDVKQYFKTLTLQFGSKWWIISTKFRIPPEGYLIISNKGNVCLGILDGSKVHDGSTIILGDISLRGQLMIYDNVNKRIGWTASDCIKAKTSISFPFFEG